MGGSLDGTLQELAEAACRAEGAELWEVRLLRGRGRSILRVTIDHQDGVAVALLQRVSQRLSRALDESDPIAEPYVLECESPGLARRLRGLEDCRRFEGAAVRLRRRQPLDGRRNLCGRIAAVREEALLLESADSGEWVPWSDVAELQLDPKL